MTSPSTTTGAGWPAGTPTLPLSDFSCRAVANGPIQLKIKVEMPNTPENWAAAGLLGQAGALAVPSVAAAPARSAAASPVRTSAAADGDDTPLASALAGTVTKPAGRPTATRSRSSAATPATRSTRARGAAATKADAGATADQQRVSETA